jgi:hypothetical protein
MENARADANRVANSQFLTRLVQATQEPLDAERTARTIGKLRSSSHRLLHLVCSGFLIAGAFYLGWRMILS